MITEFKNFKNHLTSIVQMDEASFELCLDFLKVVELNKGDFLNKEGKTCSSIAYINRGLFRIYYLKDGNEINCCFCMEDSITASFESLVNNTPSKEYLQALEDSVVVTLSKESLFKLYDLSPVWNLVGRSLTEKECLRLNNRATSLSFQTAKEKYQNLLTHQPELIQRVSIQDIASYIGVSRETLSRIRSQLTEE